MNELLTNVVPRTQQERIDLKRVGLLDEILKELKELRNDLKPKEIKEEPKQEIVTEEVEEIKPKKIVKNKKSKRK